MFVHYNSHVCCNFLDKFMKQFNSRRTLASAAFILAVADQEIAAFASDAMRARAA
jgi:hypothetical protein